MKKYNVTLAHILGYYDDEDNTPKLKLTEVIIDAEDEEKAIKKAMDEDKTHWSIYECYDDEIEELI